MLGKAKESLVGAQGRPGGACVVDRDGLSLSIISGCSSSLSFNTSGQMRCFCQSLKMQGTLTESSPSSLGCLGDIQHFKEAPCSGVVKCFWRNDSAGGQSMCDKLHGEPVMVL